MAGGTVPGAEAEYAAAMTGAWRVRGRVAVKFQPSRDVDTEIRAMWKQGSEAKRVHSIQETCTEHDTKGLRGQLAFGQELPHCPSRRYYDAKSVRAVVITEHRRM